MARVSRTAAVRLDSHCYGYELEACGTLITINLNVTFFDRNSEPILSRTVKGIGSTVPLALFDGIQKVLSARKSGALKNLDWENLGWEYKPLMSVEEALASLTNFLNGELRAR